MNRRWTRWAREHYLGVETDEELAALQARARELGDAAVQEFDRRAALAVTAAEQAKRGFQDVGNNLMAHTWDQFLARHEATEFSSAKAAHDLYFQETPELGRYLQGRVPPVFDGAAANKDWIEAYAAGAPDPDATRVGWRDPNHRPDDVTVGIRTPDVGPVAVVPDDRRSDRITVEPLEGSGVFGRGVADDRVGADRGVVPEIRAVPTDDKDLVPAGDGTLKPDPDPIEPHGWKPGDAITWDSDNELENPGIDTSPTDQVEVTRGKTVGHVAAANRKELSAGNAGMGLWGDTGVVQAVIDFQKARNLDLMAKYDYKWDPNKVAPSDLIYTPPKAWVDDWYRRKTGT